MGAEYYVAQVALYHFGKVVPSNQSEICAKGCPGFSRVSLGLSNELDVPKGRVPNLADELLPGGEEQRPSG
jgi:hypothetical protein